MSTKGWYPAVFTSIVRPPLAQGKPEPPRPYAKLPHDLAADPRLLPIDVRLLLALVFFARDKDHCWPSDATLGTVGHGTAKFGATTGTLAHGPPLRQELFVMCNIVEAFIGSDPDTVTR